MLTKPVLIPTTFPEQVNKTLERWPLLLSMSACSIYVFSSQTPSQINVNQIVERLSLLLPHLACSIYVPPPQTSSQINVNQIMERLPLLLPHLYVFIPNTFSD